MGNLVFPKTSSNIEQLKQDILNGARFRSAASGNYSTATEAQEAEERMYRSGILTREMLEQTMNKWKDMQLAYVPPYALVNTEMISEVANENARLKDKNKRLKDENEKLKKIMDIKNEKEWNALMKG